MEPARALFGSFGWLVLALALVGCTTASWTTLRVASPYHPPHAVKAQSAVDRTAHAALRDVAELIASLIATGSVGPTHPAEKSHSGYP